eukprot:COSAG01_NODE_215_length_21709_cov_141.101217_12_plen_66_part_00
MHATATESSGMSLAPASAPEPEAEAAQAEETSELRRLQEVSPAVDRPAQLHAPRTQLTSTPRVLN